MTDGERVFAYFAAIGLVAAFDMDGNEIWARDVGAFPTSNDFGTGSSLTMSDEHVFLQCDNETESFLLAMDAATGDIRWRADRKGGTCWSTPVVWQNRQRKELVVCGSDVVQSYDLKSGNMIWSFADTGGSFSSSPATDLDRVYFGNSGPGRRGPLVAIPSGVEGQLVSAGGDDETAEIAWSEPGAGPGMPSPVAHLGIVFVLSRGILSCHHAETGEQLNRVRLKGAGSIAASPWIVNDRLFVLDETGKTFVLTADQAMELVATNTIEGLFWSTPTAAGNALLMRSARNLYCIRE